jgi:vancomycin resistance protein VanW
MIPPTISGSCTARARFARSLTAAAPARDRTGRFVLAAIAVTFAAVAGWAAARHEPETVLARYVTSLRGRTPNQVHNVALAARTVHGRWIKPGGVFSFNGTVGSWSSDSGYKLAPVSYDGELVPSWGGGVCQASTTLYNAALLAGLEIPERHRHRWLAKYVAPGRDAAVAYSNIDLKLRNPHPWPVRIEGQAKGELIEFRIVGKEPLEHRYEIKQRVQAVTQPATVRQAWHEGMPVRRLRNPGKIGCRVLTYRARISGDKELSRELLSDDAYPAMNRLVLTN